MKTLVLILSLIIALSTEATTLTGIAKNQKGEILYVEKHKIKQDEAGLNQFIQVEYVKPDGRLFAKLTSDFNKNKNIPDTIFEDKRFNSKIVLRLSDSLIEFEEFKNDKVIQKSTMPLNESMVASQGFDNFIRSNSIKLSSTPVNFKFVVLENKDFYSLTGYTRSKSSDKIEYGIRSSNWFLRLITKELRVIYDPETQRLKSYQGRSNILDDRGKAQDVNISYQWTSDL